MKFLYKLVIACGIVEWGYLFYSLKSIELIDVIIIMFLAGLSLSSYLVQYNKDKDYALQNNEVKEK